MTSTLHLTSPRASIEAIPNLVGFMPHESLVIMFLQQTRLVCTVRVDLPGINDFLASPVIEEMRENQGATQCVAVAFTETDEDQWAFDVIPLLGRIEVRDLLVVHSGFAQSLFCQSDCCPFPVTLDGVNALSVADGMLPAASREALIEACAFGGEVPTYEPLPASRANIDDVHAAVERVVGMLVEPVTAQAAALWLSLTMGNIPSRDLLIAALAETRVPAPVIEGLARFIPDDAVQALAALMSTAYLSGDGGLAWILYDRIGAQNNSLAELVRMTMDAGHSPASIRSTFAGMGDDILATLK